MNELNLIIIDNFLLPHECDYLINEKKDFIERSSVVCTDTHKSVESNHRTSSGCFFKKDENQLITYISHRLACMTRTNVSQQEGFQFLKYGYKEEYTPHHDFFQPDAVDHLSRGGQRLKTALIYLNDVELGGETYLPHFNKLIQAKKGRLVLWNNLDSSGNPNDQTLHSGMPVLKGFKYCVPVWIRQSDFI